MIQKIVDVKSSVLRKKAKRIEKLDKKLLSLIKDMQDTLESQKDPEGIGLAAPQIGKSLRLFVVGYKNLKRVIINPEIIEIAKVKKVKKTKNKKSEILEGCLSLPHFYGPIVRSLKVKIKYQTPDKDGKNLITKTEEFEDFDAQIIQHEIDHLNGILFVDKILEQKAPLYKFDGDEWEEVELI